MSTSPSAWCHPFFERGRSMSGPSQCLRLPARAWRTNRTVIGSSPSRGQGVQYLSVPVVGEGRLGRVDREPTNLVDLAVGMEAPAGHIHGPIPHVLRASVAVV